MSALGVFGVVAFLLTANGMLTTGLPLGWRALGVSALDISRLAACGYAGVLLGGFVNPGIVRRIGCRRGYLFFIASFAAASAAFALPGPLVVLGLARIAAGGAIAGLYLLIESRLNSIAMPMNRARLLTTYMVVLYLAQAFGANLATSGFAAGTRLLPVVVALILIASAGLNSFPDVVVATATRGAGDVRELLRSSPEGYAGGLVAGMLLGTFYGLVPVFAESHLSSRALVGPFMATAMLGGVVGLLIAGKIARSSRASAGVAAIAVATSASAIAVVAGSAGGDDVLFVLIAVFGAVAFSLYPFGSASVNSNAPSMLRIEANGLYILTAGIGGVLGPLLAGALMSRFGDGAPFAVIAAATIALAVFVLARAGMRRRLPAIGAAGSISPTSGIDHG
jgi:hypothetical protein